MTKMTSQDPAEGSRKTIERELARDRKKNDSGKSAKPAPTPACPQETPTRGN